MAAARRRSVQPVQVQVQVHLGMIWKLEGRVLSRQASRETGRSVADGEARRGEARGEGSCMHSLAHGKHWQSDCLIGSRLPLRMHFEWSSGAGQASEQQPRQLHELQRQWQMAGAYRNRGGYSKNVTESTPPLQFPSRCELSLNGPSQHEPEPTAAVACLELMRWQKLVRIITLRE